MTFAEFVHQRRRDLNITLREFCQKHEFDAGLISKIEQGIYPARALGNDLIRYAKALDISENPTLQEKFNVLATLSQPKYPNGPSDEDIVAYMPIFGRFTEEQLQSLAQQIRQGLTYCE